MRHTQHHPGEILPGGRFAGQSIPYERPFTAERQGTNGTDRVFEYAETRKIIKRKASELDGTLAFCIFSLL